MEDKTVVLGGINHGLACEIEEMIDNKTIHRELECLGYGAFGAVYALDDYAIKVFYHRDDESCSDPLTLSALQGDDSPFLKLYAYQHRKFMISEKIDGLHLGKLTHPNDYILSKKEKKIANSFSITSGYEKGYEHMMHSIQYAYDKGFKAIDLKSDNVMIKNGLPIIVDVGNFRPTIIDGGPSYKSADDFVDKMYGRGFYWLENFYKKCSKEIIPA